MGRTRCALLALLAAAGFLTTAAGLTATPQSPTADFWISGPPVQGGLVTARAPKNTRNVFLDDEALQLSSDGVFLMGFDRDAPVQANVAFILADGSQTVRNISVAGGDWRIENVAANMTGGAKSSAEFDARRSAELARINAARALSRESNGWRQKFIRPVAGRISGLFGAQRVYNGIPGSYHTGMDIAAADAFTLEGHLLMIDHGMGLNSAFLHASELLVKEDDVVKQGQIIGRVGATGRTSGPHLHWGMKWNSARIDPKLLLPAF